MLLDQLEGWMGVGWGFAGMCESLAKPVPCTPAHIPFPCFPNCMPLENSSPPSSRIERVLNSCQDLSATLTSLIICI